VRSLIGLIQPSRVAGILAGGGMNRIAVETGQKPTTNR
jgi:ABC-type methionine transport system permease subunit